MRLILLWCVLLSSSLALAEDADLSRLFQAAGVEGTMVLSSLQSGQTFVHDQERAGRRLCPASSFKVLNTLIALDERVVTGKDSVFAWDGARREVDDWNRDQTLETAFKSSCVWCYQQMARKVGAETYRRRLAEAGYGALPERFDVAAFWLDDSLQVSAVEQVVFLKKVVRRELPYRAESYDTLKDVMRTRMAQGVTLYAKTGWATTTPPQTGWYVGYVETPRDTWMFATNLTVRSRDDLPLRQQLTLAALRAKGILGEGN